MSLWNNFTDLESSIRADKNIPEPSNSQLIQKVRELQELQHRQYGENETYRWKLAAAEERSRNEKDLAERLVKSETERREGRGMVIFFVVAIAAAELFAIFYFAFTHGCK